MNAVYFDQTKEAWIETKFIQICNIFVAKSSRQLYKCQDQLEVIPTLDIVTRFVIDKFPTVELAMQYKNEVKQN